MNRLRPVFLAVNQLVCRRFTQMVLAAVAVLPALLTTQVFGLQELYSQRTMSTTFILLPALDATVIVALAMMVLVLLELSRQDRHHISALIQSMTSPVKHLLLQVAALVICFVLASLPCILLMIPYVLSLLGTLFSLKVYLLAWFLLYMAGVCLVVLLSAGVYCITRRLDASLLILSGLILFGQLSSYGRPYLANWLRPAVWAISDATGSAAQFRLMAYTRLVGLAFSLFVFSLGLLSHRVYGKNMVQSLLFRWKKKKWSLSPVLLLVPAILLVYFEPFFDNNAPRQFAQTVDPDTGLAAVHTLDSNNYEQGSDVSVDGAEVDLFIDKTTGTVSGHARLEIWIWTQNEDGCPLWLAPGLEIQRITQDGTDVAFTKRDYDAQGISEYFVFLKGEGPSGLSIEYKGMPRNEKGPQMIRETVTADFVLLSFFIPDLRVVSSPPTKLTFTLAEHLTPLMPRVRLTERDPVRPGYRTYSCLLPAPINLIAGDYIVEHLDVDGMKVDMVYFRKKQAILAENETSKILVEAIRFFSRTFGPLELGGAPLTIAELDASFNGGWAMKGVSLYSETIFPSNAYRPALQAAHVDGGNSIATMVHEIAHHWWGIGVVCPQDTVTSWSSEGLTSYSAYLFMKYYYGAAYAEETFVKQWESAAAYMQNSFYLLHPEQAERLPAALAERARLGLVSMGTYSLMPAVIKKTEETLGEAVFHEKLAALFQDYRNGFLTFDAFLAYMGVTKEEVMPDGLADSV